MERLWKADCACWKKSNGMKNAPWAVTPEANLFGVYGSDMKYDDVCIHINKPCSTVDQFVVRHFLTLRRNTSDSGYLRRHSKSTPTNGALSFAYITS